MTASTPIEEFRKGIRVVDGAPRGGVRGETEVGDAPWRDRRRPGLRSLA